TELARQNIVVTTVFPGLMRTGSPVSAMFKGQRPQEFAWFAISDSLPLASIDARRAARQIIDACRHGDAALVMTLINQLLPAPTAGGDDARPGRENLGHLAGSRLAAPMLRTAETNNEL